MRNSEKRRKITKREEVTWKEIVQTRKGGLFVLMDAILRLPNSHSDESDLQRNQRTKEILERTLCFKCYFSFGNKDLLLMEHSYKSGIDVDLLPLSL